MDFLFTMPNICGCAFPMFIVCIVDQKIFQFFSHYSFARERCFLLMESVADLCEYKPSEHLLDKNLMANQMVLACCLNDQWTAMADWPLEIN